MRGAIKQNREAGFRIPPEHETLPCPALAVQVMMYFRELEGSHQSTGFGISPLSFTEIDAWMRLMGRRLEPFEVSLLKDVDLVYLGVRAARSESKKFEAKRK